MTLGGLYHLVSLPSVPTRVTYRPTVATTFPTHYHTPSLDLFWMVLTLAVPVARAALFTLTLPGLPPPILPALVPTIRDYLILLDHCAFTCPVRAATFAQNRWLPV